jgi:hypothetical protein
VGKLYIKPVNSEEYVELSGIKEINVSDSTTDKLFGEKHMADVEMIPTKFEFTSDLKASVFEWDRFVIAFCGIDEWFEWLIRQIIFKRVAPGKCEKKIITQLLLQEQVNKFARFEKHEEQA